MRRRLTPDRHWSKIEPYPRRTRSRGNTLTDPIDLEEQKINLEDASLFKFIANILEGDKERRILLILNLIENLAMLN